MGAELFFESVEYLEPRCPNCRSKVKYGVTTRFDDEVEAHRCLNCDFILK